jgi:hypothetical protein
MAMADDLPPRSAVADESLLAYRNPEMPIDERVKDLCRR